MDRRPTRPGPWSAELELAADRPTATRLVRALAPEAAREVPRARTALALRKGGLSIRLEAAESGAMRAALNTHLGWIALAVATEVAARSAAVAPARPKGLS
ncbi:MAG TPA: KEOPS complex subunit Pcc1 [Thermoplasmata archaeon]|nr:KEOPS complex subunit Pcc1 [Thermoplasmata archaeon]